MEISYFRECFEADFLKGVLTWKIRPLYHFPTERGWKIFNGSKAGKVVGGKFFAKDGYVRVRVNIQGRFIYLHNILWMLWTGEKIPEGYEVDHIDRDGSNNSVSNLRLLTRKQNCSNRLHTGTLFYRKYQKWCTRLFSSEYGYVVNNYFEDKSFAEEVYKCAHMIVHKEFSPWSGTILRVDFKDTSGISKLMYDRMSNIGCDNKEVHKFLEFLDGELNEAARN